VFPLFTLMRSYILLFICCFAVTAAFAQTHRDEVGIQTDNDSYLAAGSDRYYTNGLFLYFNHALKVKSPDSTALQNKILGFELGQKIYTPQAGYIPSTIFVDRPFAGYLYAASSLNLLFENESNIKLSAQIGIIGPASLGEAAQDLTHRILGQYKGEGWQYQIKNNPELNLSMVYNKLLARGSAIDLSLTSYANLGTGFTGAGVGPLLRIGDFNQLFHSQSTQSNVIANENTKPLHPSELFFYYKPQINVVAYDATIEGGLFESHNHDDEYYYYYNSEVVRTIEPVIFSQQLGAVYSTSRWVYDLSATFRTKDTKEMTHPTHQWGSLEVLYRFN
jgi:lipid A 3-O-deacylase